MNKRQIALLEYLMRQTDFVTAKDLANHYGVSTKTIYQDIDKLNDHLMITGLSIDKAPRKGVRLALSDQEKVALHKVMSLIYPSLVADYSPEFRENILIKRLFLEDQVLDIYDLSEQLFVTESSIHRDVDRLADFFSPFQVQVLIRSNKVQVLGQERDIRKALRSFIIDKIMEHDERIDQLSLFFDAGQVQACQEAIDSLSTKYQHPFSSDYYFLLLLECLVLSCRLSAHHPLEDRMSQGISDINHLEVYFFAGELLERLLDCPLIDLPSYEIEALAYSLLGVGFNIQASAYSKDLKDQVTAFIQKVSDLLSLDLTRDEHLALMLSNHMYAMIFRLQKKMHVTNPALEEIKKQYSSLFNIVWLSSRDLSEVYDLDIPDAELAFLVIHFQLAIEKIVRPLHIVVVCQSGIATSELIMSKLTRVFDSNEKVDNISFKDLQAYDLSQVDLIVSAIHLPAMPVPVIEVSPIMTNAELQEVRTFYASLATDNYRLLKTTFHQKTFEVARLENLMKEPRLVRVAVKNKADCLKRIIQEASVQNRENGHFESSIKLRESLGSTSVYTGVALPHCDPRFVKHSELIVMSLDKPIEWGKNQVKVVILIAIAERDIALFKDSLIALYSVIENQALIEALAACPDGGALKRRLLEEVSQNVR